jgi:diguanylate cyclase (GGDEF)-like protein
LTGIANRSAFYEMVGREIERQRRYRRPFGLAYIDCDNFKAVNDSLGHHAGDDPLRSIGAVLGAGLRRTDVVARQREDAAASLLTQLKAGRRTPILPANSGRNR